MHAQNGLRKILRRKGSAGGVPEKKRARTRMAGWWMATKNTRSEDKEATSRYQAEDPSSSAPEASPDRRDRGRGSLIAPLVARHLPAEL